MKVTIPAPYCTLRERVQEPAALPGWAVVTLDSLIGAGVVRADALDGLNSTALIELAAQAVRHAHEGFSA